jgi:hypothetical protein
MLKPPSAVLFIKPANQDKGNRISAVVSRLGRAFRPGNVWCRSGAATPPLDALIAGRVEADTIEAGADW